VWLLTTLIVSAGAAALAAPFTLPGSLLVDASGTGGDGTGLLLATLVPTGLGQAVALTVLYALSN
jgi:hypothetical protein